MKHQEIINLVQRADKVQWTSRAAMLVEFNQDGELLVSTYGHSLSIGFMTKALRKLLNNE